MQKNGEFHGLLKNTKFYRGRIHMARSIAWAGTPGVWQGAGCICVGWRGVFEAVCLVCLWICGLVCAQYVWGGVYGVEYAGRMGLHSDCEGVESVLIVEWGNGKGSPCQLITNIFPWRGLIYAELY